MSDRGLSVDERALRDLLRVWTVLFAAGALNFAVAPERTLATLGGLPGEPLPRQDRFWNALAVSLMATLTTLCAVAASDVRQNRSWVRPVLVSKAVSSGMYLLRFVENPRGTTHLVGALCDGSILAVTLRRYRAAAR